MINVFNDVEIICWGELLNFKEIHKICPKIIEAQKEEWASENQFYNKTIAESKTKYSLIINDKAEIIIPQVYFMRTLAILEKHPVVSFVYTDYNSVLLPSFKPFIFMNYQNEDCFPILIRNNKNKPFIEQDKKYLSVLIKVLSEHLIGYHIPECLIKIYE
jgi:hypothetical protein